MIQAELRETAKWCCNIGQISSTLQQAACCMPSTHSLYLFLIQFHHVKLRSTKASLLDSQPHKYICLNVTCQVPCAQPTSLLPQHYMIKRITLMCFVSRSDAPMYLLGRVSLPVHSPCTFQASVLTSAPTHLHLASYLYTMHPQVAS